MILLSGQSSTTNTFKSWISGGGVNLRLYSLARRLKLAVKWKVLPLPN